MRRRLLLFGGLGAVVFAAFAFGVWQGSWNYGTGENYYYSLRDPGFARVSYSWRNDSSSSLSRLSVRELERVDGFAIKGCANADGELWRPGNHSSCDARIDAALIVVSNTAEYPISQQFWCDVYPGWFTQGILFVGGLWGPCNNNDLKRADPLAACTLPRKSVNTFYEAVAAAMASGIIDAGAGALVVHDDVAMMPWNLGSYDLHNLWYVTGNWLDLRSIEAVEIRDRGSARHAINEGAIEAMLEREHGIRKKLAENMRRRGSCDSCFLAQTYSDVFYIPRPQFAEFVALSAIFAHYGVFCETAVPNMVQLMAEEDKTIEPITVSVVTRPAKGTAPSPMMMESGHAFYHPVKMGCAKCPEAALARTNVAQLHLNKRGHLCSGKMYPFL